MNTPDSSIIQLLEARHSVRAFTDAPLAPQAVRTLQADITMINTHEAGLHFALVEGDSAPMRSASGFYGTFRNASNFVACIVEPAFPEAYVRAGYCAEQLAISALRLGIASCFVAATFSRDAVRLQMRAGWELPFILLLGYPDTDRRRPLDKLVTWATHRRNIAPTDLLLNPCDDIDPTTDLALRALACAPSHLNRRPARLRLTPDGPEACLTSQSPSVLEQIDLGIAQYNIDAALQRV